MSNKSNEELKLKGKFLINIESRTEEKKLKFTKWLNAQSNPQNSFLSLIEHCIDRFGYVDVTDHEIAKKLHTEILYFNNNEMTQTNVEVDEPTNFQANNELITEKFAVKTQNEDKAKEIDQRADTAERNNIDADLSSF